MYFTDSQSPVIEIEIAYFSYSDIKNYKFQKSSETFYNFPIFTTVKLTLNGETQ